MCCMAYEETEEGLMLSVPMMRAAWDRHDNKNMYETYYDGHDSNNQCSLFLDAVANKNNAEVKDPMDEEEQEATPAEIPSEMLTLITEEVKKMTLNQLKEEVETKLHSKVVSLELLMCLLGQIEKKARWSTSQVVSPQLPSGENSNKTANLF